MAAGELGSDDLLQQIGLLCIPDQVRVSQPRVIVEMQAAHASGRFDDEFNRLRPEGGAFIAIEALIDDARRQNAFGLMMSLNMLIEFGVAFDYTGADFSRWCKEVGFWRTEIIPLAGPSRAAVAYK